MRTFADYRIIINTQLYIKQLLLSLYFFIINKIVAIITLIYLKKYKENINLKIWNKAIINFTNANKQDLNKFLLHCIAHYKNSKYNNTAL